MIIMDKSDILSDLSLPTCFSFWLVCRAEAEQVK